MSGETRHRVDFQQPRPALIEHEVHPGDIPTTESPTGDQCELPATLGDSGREFRVKHVAGVIPHILGVVIVIFHRGNDLDEGKRIAAYVADRQLAAINVLLRQQSLASGMKLRPGDLDIFPRQADPKIDARTIIDGFEYERRLQIAFILRLDLDGRGGRHVCGDTLPLIEIIPAMEYYDYDAKYVRDDTRYVLDPELPAGVTERCEELTLVACRRLGCRDVARVDFMLDERGPWLLEVNTMPGFTTHSLVPMASAHAGRPMFELCAHLAQTALDRSPHWTPINVRSSFD